MRLWRGLVRELLADGRPGASPEGKLSGLAKSGAEKFRFVVPKTGLIEPLTARFRLSRRRRWILRVRKLPVRGSRALYDIWDPISGPSAQKCGRFLNIFKIAMKHLKFSYFVWPAESRAVRFGGARRPSPRSEGPNVGL